MSNARTGTMWDKAWAAHAGQRAPNSIFPVEPYRLVERHFSRRHLAQAETLFAVSNGFLGVRGAFEEARPFRQQGTFINGFYESWPIVYGEEAYGFAKTGQTMVEVPDGATIKLYVDDEPLDVRNVQLLEYERALDMAAGAVTRHMVWETADGRRLKMRSKRFTSLEYRHLLVADYQVEILDEPATLTISSELASHEHSGAGLPDDPRKARTFDGGVLQPVHSHTTDDRAVFSMCTTNSGMTVACGMQHTIETDCGHERTLAGDVDDYRETFLIDGQPGSPVRIAKFVAYHASPTATSEELCFRVDQTIDRALHAGADELSEIQRNQVQDFWDRSAVTIDGAPALQQAVNFNTYQVFQASARAENHGIPAKGLTGSGYEGHYFWDTEIYVMPFLTYTSPRLAKNLIRFRHQMLPKARERAAEVGHKGALYPWRTISGDEASAYYAAGTAQYHINGDIVFALMKYVRATGDLEFLALRGAEMLVETARLWPELGFFNHRRNDRFVINGVTGPDEYTTVVNNNAYTNLLARDNLRAAVGAVEWLRMRRPDDYEILVHRTGVTDDELALWRRAADHMLIPYDRDQRVHLQDDAFLDREVWDFENTPPENYPLLLHYHPLEIYRHQVIKQADMVLATFLLNDDFTFEEKARIFEYYDPLTTGDSSLSESIQSIMATEIGDLDKACEYFADSVLIDLLDLKGNVRDGLHIASAGGTWLTLVYGFGGLRDHDGELRFRPVIPDGWERLSFPLQRRDNLLEVEITHDEVVYRLTKGTRVVVHHWDDEIALNPGDEARIANPPIL